MPPNVLNFWELRVQLQRQKLRGRILQLMLRSCQKGRLSLLISGAIGFVFGSILMALLQGSLVLDLKKFT
ncbi:unnamed protein product [Prunus armeniaca]